MELLMSIATVVSIISIALILLLLVIWITITIIGQIRDEIKEFKKR